MTELTQDFIMLLSAGTFILMMTTCRLVIKIAEKMGIKDDEID